MSIVDYETAVRLYFEQLPPGSSQIIPDRAEYDISRDVVILRRGGQALATYAARDIAAAAEWDEAEEWEEAPTH